MEKAIGIVLGALIIVALAGMLLNNNSTGAAGIPFKNPQEPAQSYKIEVIDHVTAFFGTGSFVFPDDSCASAVENVFSQMREWETSRMEVFSAGNSDRFLAMIFEEQKKLGKMTLVKGFGVPDSVRLHLTISKTVISISDWQEVMQLDIELNGRQNGNAILVTKGKMGVLDFNCSFGY